ncbi:MAG: DUF1292 domain-containing protein [Lachnospiraceae bacterium]
MDKIEFFDEESSEYVEFYVLEQTRINNTDYLLVTVDEEGDSDALILKDTSAQDEQDAVYQIVEEDNELQAVAKVFAELIGDEADLEL